MFTIKVIQPNNRGGTFSKQIVALFRLFKVVVVEVGGGGECTFSFGILHKATRGGASAKSRKTTGQDRGISGVKLERSKVMEFFLGSFWLSLTFPNHAC